ncbi:MAG TPA: hypothetical protein VKY24_00725 [Reyranella sp.]|nr:hypothetical protein [Reyranella sp.]
MTPLERLLLEAVRVGVDMRAAQARYFKATRGSDEKSAALRESVVLDRGFDTLAAHAIRASEVEQ